jgi:hypothetical protein
MVTQGFTPIAQEPETALLPTHPNLREEDHGEAELAVTRARLGSHGDRRPTVTNTRAIVVAHNVTAPCKAIRQYPPYAGDGRGGNGQHPPVCISYPQPGDSHQRQTEARRIQTSITHLLQIIDSPDRHFGSPVWEEEGGQPHFQPSKVQTVQQSPFLIAGQRGKFVLMRWGAIYEAPACMWEQGGNEGGVAWQ